MRRRLGYVGLTILMSGLPLAAHSSARPAGQQPSPATTAQQTPKEKPSNTGNETLMGCLRSTRADTTTADTKGNLYTLEVMDTPSTGSTEVGAPAPGTSGPITYALSAPDSVGLGKHVGHQVQVSGKLKPPNATEPPAAGTPTTAAPGAKPGHISRTFEVSALKMISAKCP
jgi:hypothetical protein